MDAGTSGAASRRGNVAAWALVTLSLLTSCGGAPPPGPPGTPVEARLVASGGPRIANGSILAASDLETLRALVDASAVTLARQAGGVPVTHQCRPPYTFDVDRCWPGASSTAGRAYVALDIAGGFCETAGPPRLAVSGTHLEVQVTYSGVLGCHVNGVLALPTASLVSFPTGGLRPGLYRVSYLFQYANDRYRSDSTYLSVPAPAPAPAADLDRDAADALASVLGAQPSGLFSLARVDGTQLGALCGQTVSGPAYLVTAERDLSETPRHMTVVLAGPAPRTCSVTPV